jgi:hypothetical protein
MATDTAQVAWRVKKGSRKTLSVPVVDLDGEPLPVDGWDVTATVLERPGETVLYTFPTEHIVIDTDENVVRLVVPAPVSAAWAWHIGFYLVIITDPATDPDDPATYRVLSGPFIADP